MSQIVGALIQIFDDVELPRHSELPVAVRKEAMLRDELVVGIDGLFVLPITLVGSLLSLRFGQRRQLAPKCPQENAR